MTHRRETRNSSWGREERRDPEPLDKLVRIVEGPRPYEPSPIIDSMARMRMKPRGVDRTVLVDRETRIFNDRLWSERGREDQKAADARAEAAARPAPKVGFFRRLFG
jgi:hypothetical protein